MHSSSIARSRTSAASSGTSANSGRGSARNARTRSISGFSKAGAKSSSGSKSFIGDFEAALRVSVSGSGRRAPVREDLLFASVFKMASRCCSAPFRSAKRRHFSASRSRAAASHGRTFTICSYTRSSALSWPVV